VTNIDAMRKQLRSKEARSIRLRLGDMAGAAGGAGSVNARTSAVIGAEDLRDPAGSVTGRAGAPLGIVSGARRPAGGGALSERGDLAFPAGSGNSAFRLGNNTQEAFSAAGMEAFAGPGSGAFSMPGDRPLQTPARYGLEIVDSSGDGQLATDMMDIGPLGSLGALGIDRANAQSTSLGEENEPYFGMPSRPLAVPSGRRLGDEGGERMAAMRKGRGATGAGAFPPALAKP